MHRTILLWACLACEDHGWQLQSPALQSESPQFASNPSPRALANFLVALNPTAAFNARGPGRLHPVLAVDKHHGCELCAPSMSLSPMEHIAKSQITEFQELWQSGRSDELAKMRLREILSRGKIYGRVVHAKGGRFEYLHPASWKRFAFVFGRRALEAFLGKDAREIAAHLEMPACSIDRQIGRGHVYKLVLFGVSTQMDCHLATWDNLDYMVRKHYPEVSDKVCAQLPHIRNMTFTEIQELADYDMSEAHRTREFWGRDLAEFDGTLVGVRQWLWDQLGLNDDFTGTGYTKGYKGTREYLTVNSAISELPGCVAIELEM